MTLICLFGVWGPDSRGPPHIGPRRPDPHAWPWRVVRPLGPDMGRTPGPGSGTEEADIRDIVGEMGESVFQGLFSLEYEKALDLDSGADFGCALSGPSLAGKRPEYRSLRDFPDSRLQTPP